MEEKEDHIEVGKFWDELEKELDLESNPSKPQLADYKPLLPKSSYIPTNQFSQIGSESNSIKIERKTPLDYMVRKNQQMKINQQNNLPTFTDYQHQVTPQKPIDPIEKLPSYSALKKEQQEIHQLKNHTIYPRYQIDESQKSTPPPQPPVQKNDYLRSQMIKELRSQQQRNPISPPKGRLQPPNISVPPRPVNFSPPSPSPQTQILQAPDQYVGYDDEVITEPEIINEMELIRCLHNIQDRTKIDVLLQLLDGNWHSEAELIRIAKKTRDFIGSVGFGMLMCSFEDIISKSFLIKKIDPCNYSQFKINENYIHLARSAYSQYKKTEN